MSFDATKLADPREFLREDRGFQGLTVKQEDYANARLGGLQPLEALKSVYAPNTENYGTLSNMAAQLEANPRIQGRIRQLLAERQQKTSFAPIQVDRDFVIQGVATLALTAAKDADKLKAYDMLGKSVGIDLFRETVIHEKRERSVEDVEKDLRAKLDAMRKTIDGEARDVPPGSGDKDPPG